MIFNDFVIVDTMHFYVHDKLLHLATFVSLLLDNW